MRLIAVLIAIFALAACSNEQPSPAPVETSSTQQASETPAATDSDEVVCGEFCNKIVQAHDTLKSCVAEKTSMCAKELTSAYIAADSIIKNGNSFPPAASATFKVLKENFAEQLQAFLDDSDEYTAASCKDAQLTDQDCSLKLQQAALALDLALLMYTPK